MKIAFIIAILAALCHAQTEVRVSEVEPPANQYVFGYSGTNLIYVCKAISFQSTGQRAGTFVAISGVSKAAAAVVTSAGHGFAISSRPKVTISGATGTGWTAINAVWVATVIDANTFSIPINSSGFGTLAGTVLFSTTGPRSTMPEWSVQQLVYDGTPLLIWKGWMNGSAGYVSKCSEAATASIQRQ